ncbi:MAG: exo-alpha-sialidase [Anaerolineae bacterium]|nr:exo-alpha-sialidase [Anaerolineae bacterium]
MRLEHEHTVVCHSPSHWAAVPANNGGNGPIWQWGDEMLVGFTRGIYSDLKPGHQCSYDHPFESWLARSVDGGENWVVWRPEPYVGGERDGGAHPGSDRRALRRLDSPVATDPGFVMRVEGNGYHGNQGAQWYASQDRGTTWRGPFGFGDLLGAPELQGFEFTGRTAYEVRGPGALDIYVSARRRPEGNVLNVVYDKPFVARTTDDGGTFRFVSWIVGGGDPYRAVMPAPARLTATKLVVALRRKSSSENWIDCFASEDDGVTWSFLSRVGKTEDANQFNGNPPAMVRLADGRLCCAFGNRSRRQIVATLSDDEGATWGPERVLRDDFHSANGWPDLGYCRLFQRTDGGLVVVYFWCTRERPQTHIEATLFLP